MNQSKIATLYATSGYAQLLAVAVTPETPIYLTLDYRLRSLLFDHEILGWDGSNYRGRTVYAAEVRDLSDKDQRADDEGKVVRALYDAYLPERVYRWATAQVPQGDAEAIKAEGQALWVGMTSLHHPKGSTEEPVGHFGHGTAADFATLLRGLRAYHRKQAKNVKKLTAQLAAHHRAIQEQLRQGFWLGTDKAPTTAARVNEPGVPFMGDVAKRPAGLAYWVTPADGGMDTHFPAGTGVALRRVNRSRDLVDGAVYVWTWQWGKEAAQSTTVIGRCDLSAKERGMLPIRHEDGKLMPMCWLNWTSPEIRVYRVTHYTTRAEALAPVMVAETQPVLVAQPALRGKKRKQMKAAA